MGKVQIKTTWDYEIALDENAIAQFDLSFQGDLIRPGDEAYESARRVYNAMIDKHPRLIARAIDVADVITCVNFARENGLLLAVRGGGHNGGGLGTCDNGLMLDLSQMKGIRVDPDSRTVRAEGGCTQGEIGHAAAAFGLAIPAGTVSGNRHRRPDPRRRPRVSHPQVRAEHRQPPGSRCRDRRRPSGGCLCGQKSGPLLGHPRRRRQLRRRHQLPVPASPGQHGHGRNRCSGMRSGHPR